MEDFGDGVVVRERLHAHLLADIINEVPDLVLLKRTVIVDVYRLEHFCAHVVERFVIIENDS